MRYHAHILALLLFALPFSASAVLVNINTADATLLDTLPGIGPSKAGAIVEYRTQHGLFIHTEDIQNVSGIGTSTYEGMKPFITIGDVVSSVPTTSASSTTSTTEPSVAGTAYVPPPSLLLVNILGNQTALLKVPLRLTAHVTTKSGAVDTSAQIMWSFGDGSKGEGSVVEKTYQYAGTYLVVATATDGSTTARDEFIVTATPASVHLLPVSGDGMTIANDTSERLDLSGWWLSSGGGSFRIPEGTMLLPKSSVLFPFAITNLPMTFEARLAYPSGSVAANSAPAMVAMPAVATVQPPEERVSYKQVQKVEPIINPKTIVQFHEEAVVAPATSTELAVAGAPLLPAQAAASANAPIAGLLRSSWTFGLLGVMTLAAGAFILL